MYTYYNYIFTIRISLSLYIYIYIYIEREREREIKRSQGVGRVGMACWYISGDAGANSHVLMYIYLSIYLYK